MKILKTCSNGIVNCLLMYCRRKSFPISHCSGFTSLKADKECTKEIDGILYIIEGNEKKVYFCTPQHMLRYLLRYYGRQGKKQATTRKKRKITSNTQEEEDDNGTDE